MKYTDFYKPEDITVEKIWSVLALALFKGRDVSKTQHDEMRRTFYMGFTECFKIMTDLAEELTEDQAASILSKIHGEVTDFHAKEIVKLLPDRQKN